MFSNQISLMLFSWIAIIIRHTIASLLIMQDDPGGVNAVGANNGHVGNAQQISMSQAAFRSRQEKVFGLILRHMENETFKDAARQMHNNFVQAAFAPVGGAAAVTSNELSSFASCIE